MNSVNRAVAMVMNTITRAVRSMSDEKYLAVLYEVLDKVDARLAILEGHDDEAEDFSACANEQCDEEEEDE